MSDEVDSLKAPLTKIAPGSLIAGSVIGCVIAAIVSILVVDRLVVLTVEPINMPNDEQLAEYNAARAAFRFTKATVDVSIIGAMFGLFAGLLGIRKLPGTLLATATGAISGALGGYLSVAAVMYFEGFRDVPPVWAGVSIDPLLQAFLAQCLVWCLIGIGVGGGLLLLSGRGVKSCGLGAIGGLIGGLAGACLYAILSSVIFSSSNNVYVRPAQWGELLLWASIGGFAVAAGIVRAVSPGKSMPDSSPA